MNTCQVCNKEYKPTRYPQYYCSRDCFYKSTIGHESYVTKATIAKICEMCGKEFLTGGRLGKSYKKYCSVDCLYKSKYKSNIVPNDLSIQDKAYLAGILDGEGNISLLKNRSRNPRVRIQIANTDYRLIDWLVVKTGVGNINTRPGTDEHKTAYTWICNNEPAILILQQIRDYLVIKQDRCDLAIKASDLLNKFQDIEDISFNMEYIYNQMRILNKKGPI